jgi:hypothetical protein
MELRNLLFILILQSCWAVQAQSFFNNISDSIASGYDDGKNLNIPIEDIEVAHDTFICISIEVFPEDPNLNIPIITIEDIEAEDEGAADQSISPVLYAGRDPFLNAAAFNFSIARFRVRGYDNDFFSTYVNGIPTEYIDNGFGAFTLWAGLNEVTRNRDNTIGMNSNPLTIGSIGGVYTIDARASKQRKQLAYTIGTSNRTYDLRTGITYSSGITPKNWAFSVSVVGRYAKSGYVPGTSLQSLSYFAAVEKLWHKHSLALTAFGAPTKQGKAANTVREAYELVGSNFYNPAWGYQNGKLRNSRMEYRHQPVLILTHEWKIADNMNLLTAAGYSFGERTLSNIDRFLSANDPRPDYYRGLPSFYQTDNNPNNDFQAAILRQEILDNPEKLEFNWDNLYLANQQQPNYTVENAEGIAGNTVAGARAVYVLRDEVQRHQRASMNAVFNVKLKEKVDITAGLTYQFQHTNYFLRAKDLLGADFHVDVNSFLEGDLGLYAPQTQNNLLNPNNIVREGDVYGYDYAAIIHKTAVWVQLNHHFKKADWFAAGAFSNTTQWREGHFKHGVNPDNSYGKSKRYAFYNFAVKSGLTYKITGRHYLYANGMMLSRAPYWDNLFIAPRVRDIANPQAADLNEKIGSVEGGYILNHPKVRMRATAYFTKFVNGSNTLLFYDDLTNNFGNYTLNNIDKIHYGGELGIDVQLFKGLSANLAAAVGRYFYTDRQDIIITVDNLPDYVAEDIAYTKNFFIANTPQQAYTLGLNYRSKKYWRIGMSVNFFDWAYAEISPERRTQSAVNGVEPNSEQYYKIIRQENLYPKGRWTLDASGGYSWRLKSTFKKMKKHTAYIDLNAGISNLTNNRNIPVSGREQLRFDIDYKNPDKFANRYAYAFGLNFYVNVGFRM